jgi:hypothetical protein
MEPTPNTLSENTGVQPVKLLNRNLVGVMDLYALATQPHWSAVSGTLAAFGQSLREAIGLVTSSGEVDTADLIFRDLAGRRPATLFPRLSLYVEKMKKRPRPRALPQHRGDGSKSACSIMRISGQFFAFIGRSRAVSIDRIASWANEGGAGGDVNR